MKSSTKLLKYVHLQSYKYKPKKRTVSSESSSGTNFPISPPTSNSSGDRSSPDALRQSGTEDDDIAAEQELDARDDSLGSLEDLDLLDIGAIDDNGMQDIIEEVMTEEDGARGNEENAPPPVDIKNIKMKEPKLVIPKLTQAVLAPKKRCPLKNVTNNENEKVATIPIQQKRPGPGRPRKNKVNILKPVTTVYKKTSVPQKAEPEFKTETLPSLDGASLPPVKRVKLTEAEIIDILQDASSLPGIQKSASATKKVEEIEKELLAVEKMFSLEEENPPSVDNPRQYRELEAAEATYIGDMERTFRVFDELSMTEPQDDKHIEFMKKLDDWGVDRNRSSQQFDGFYQDESKLMKSDMEELGIPDGWRDEELFRDLDSRTETESVFLNTWLPKFALKIRKDNYRTLLRSLNKKDPEFNVIW